MRRLGLLLLVPLLLACGRKGPPVVPKSRVPEAVSQLSAYPRGKAVVLTWRMPRRNTDGSALSPLEGFLVLRGEVTRAVVAGTCRCEFREVGFVDLDSPKDAEISGGRVRYTDRDAALAWGHTYAYRVIPLTRDKVRGVASKEVVLHLPPLPPPPRNVRAEARDAAVLLRWDPPPLSPEARLAGYNVYRSTKPGSYGTEPVNRQVLTGTSFMDMGLKNGVAYFYTVRSAGMAQPPWNEGEPSREVTATPRDTTPPAPPRGLQAVAGKGRVRLIWEPNTEADLGGYRVYRAEGPERTPRPIATLPPHRTTFTDEKVRRGVTYVYTVTALDNAPSANESPPAAQVTATPQ